MMDQGLDTNHKPVLPGLQESQLAQRPSVWGNTCPNMQCWGHTSPGQAYFTRLSAVLYKVDLVKEKKDRGIILCEQSSFHQPDICHFCSREKKIQTGLKHRAEKHQYLLLITCLLTTDKSLEAHYPPISQPVQHVKHAGACSPCVQAHTIPPKRSLKFYGRRTSVAI